MKLIFIAFFLLTIHTANIFSQTTYDKRQIIMKIHDWENEPLAKKGSISYTYNEELIHARYDSNKLRYIFDSIPVNSTTGYRLKVALSVECSGYVPQEYFVIPETDLVFQLGTRGSSYTAREGLFYPVRKIEGLIGIQGDWDSKEEKDSSLKILDPIFDSLGLSLVIENLSRGIVHLEITNSIETNKVIEKLMSHPLINFAGPVCMYPGQGFEKFKRSSIPPPFPSPRQYSKIGFLRSSIAVKFEDFYNLPNDSTIHPITDAEIERINNKYKLKRETDQKDFLKGEFNMLNITRASPDTVDKLSILLLNEPSVKSVHVAHVPFVSSDPQPNR